MGLLRLLLALSVLLSHTGFVFGIRTMPGFLAVQIFFIISGFYMALIITQKYTGINGSYKLFITNRFLRIYPLYWLVLVVSILFSLFWAHNGQANLFQTLPDINSVGISRIFFEIYTVFRNIFLYSFYVFIPTEWDKMGLVVTGAWSIEQEFIFYLIAPFIVVLKTKKIVILFLIFLIFRFSFNIYFNRAGEPMRDVFFPAQLCFFLLGVLSYKLYERIKMYNFSKKYIAISFLPIILIFIYKYIPEINPRYVLYINDWITLFVIAISIPFLFKLTSHLKIDNFIGDFSYPIYLLHPLILFTLLNSGAIKEGDFRYPPIVMFMTIFISFILVLFFEKKIDKYRQKRLKKTSNIKHKI